LRRLRRFNWRTVTALHKAIDVAEPGFFKLQRAFTDHLRNPAQVAPPPLPEARLAVYRDAVFLNIERFMRDNFPRLAAVLPAAIWQGLMRDYIVRHAARTPLFVELLSEFLVYLEHERQEPLDPLWLRELAHFDWLENTLASDLRECESGSATLAPPLMTHPLTVNPVHQLVRYVFPVHALSVEYLPAEPPSNPTLLLTFRAPSYDVAALDLNDAAAELFVAIREGLAPNEALGAIAEAIGHRAPAQLIAFGEQMIRRWYELGLVLGVRPAGQTRPIVV
jgi:hypothetical protein